MPGGIGYQYTYLLTLRFTLSLETRRFLLVVLHSPNSDALFRHRLALFAVPPFASAFNRMGPNAARLSSSSAKDVGG